MTDRNSSKPNTIRKPSSIFQNLPPNIKNPMFTFRPGQRLAGLHHSKSNKAVSHEKRDRSGESPNPFASEKKTTKSDGFSTALKIAQSEPSSDDDFRSTKTLTKSSTTRSLDKSTDDSAKDDKKLFILPRKKQKTDYDTTSEMETFVQASKENESNKDKKVCPYCSELLFPLTENLEKALLDIEEKDRRHERRQLADFAKLENTPSLSKPLNMVDKRVVSIEEKDAFCKLHKLELVWKPQAAKRGYPTKIDFDGLEKRVRNFDTELKLIIQNKCKSDFRKVAEDAYKNLGKNKARSTISLMDRFERSLPGYYGPKGSSVILSALTKLYMDTGYLQKELKSPQMPLEFLQQVMVPEVGHRLIRQDLHRKGTGAPIPGLNEKSRAVMEESREYGIAMFPVEDQKIETEESTSILVDSDDSDSDSSDNVMIIDQEIISDDDSD